LPDKYDAVIFDMDGTIIESLLDFTVIRTELGLPPGSGTLEAIEAMPPDRREAAHRTLLEHELKAARQADLVPHAKETVDAIRRAGLKAALLTRNARVAMEIVLQRFALHFDLTWSRENGPIKPEPSGVLRACQVMGVLPQRTACVGDYHYDIIAANAAGAVSVLLARSEPPPYADEAKYVITTLAELPQLLGI
jgi:HAD superfamily hydrolase (TIGR01509 family)